MSDILGIINEKFDNKYAYLRLGRVNISSNEKRASVSFSLPEDIYETSFNTSDIQAIESTVSEVLGEEFKIVCQFEKIILSEELFKNALIVFLEKNFPLIAANIDFEKARIAISADLTLRLTVHENIYKYISTVPFEKKIREFALARFVIDVKFEYDILPDELITYQPIELNRANRYGRTVQVSDKKTVFGSSKLIVDPALHISALRGDGQDVICCGKVKYLKFVTRDEKKKVEGKRFYKNYYMFSISDTTGVLNVFINLDGEIPDLKDGVDVVCRGRVNLRDDMASFSMYARAVALCKVPYDVIAEQTKPLSAPDHYSAVEPKPYEEISYEQTTVGLLAPKTPVFVEPTVTIALRTLRNEKTNIPYEVAMCRIEGSAIVEYLHTYLRVGAIETDEQTEFVLSKTALAPRFTSVIPDLVRFSDGKLIVAENPAFIMEILNAAAKPLRYVFRNETKSLSLEGEKSKSKTESALDEAIALAKQVLDDFD